MLACLTVQGRQNEQFGSFHTEENPDIPRKGIIALQVHGNLAMEAWYRNVRIKEL